MIPLVGCRVAVLTGPVRGEGRVVTVTDARDVLRRSASDFHSLSQSMRAANGKLWYLDWYAADVQVGEAVLVGISSSGLRILEPALTRAALVKG